MKLFSVEYIPEENEGVYALSVVKSPAMQSNWITLKEDIKQPTSVKLATVDEERKILMGIALIPNKPIYRNDKGTEYNIIFPSKVVEQAAHDFVKKGNVNNSTQEHEIDLGSDAVSVVESWIIEDETNDKTRKYGFNEPVGSWAVMMKVHDDEVWAKAKKGEILGFSIDGIFNLKEISKKVNMSDKKQELNALQKFGKALLEFGEKKQEAKPEEVALASFNVMDGENVMEVMYEGETLEEGVAVFIENEGERVPLPVGDYKLEDGKTLVVAEEGIVESIAEVEEEVEEEMSEDEMKSFMDALDKAFGLSEIKTQLSELKTENETLKVQLAEYGKKPAVKKITAKTETVITEPKTAKERILAKIQKHKN